MPATGHLGGTSLAPGLAGPGAGVRDSDRFVSGRQAARRTGNRSGTAIAATTFALALAAIWLGCSLAVVAVAARTITQLDRRSIGSPFSASLCPVACAVLLAGRLLGEWAERALAGDVGRAGDDFARGFLPRLGDLGSVRNWAAAAAVLLICFMAMIALGGWIWPLPQMSLPAQLLAEAMPSRWAFEGLFLLETDQHRAPLTPRETGPVHNHDLVEEFFPADSERMGVTADAMALGSMLIGLAALAMFISGRSRPDP